MMKKSLLVVVLGIGLLVLGSVQVADAALVAQWTFNEGSGTTAFDSTPNGNDGTLVSNAAFATSGTSGYVVLNPDIVPEGDTPDSVSVPASPSLDIGAVTMVAWMKIPSPAIGNGFPTIVGKPINSSYSLWYNAGGDRKVRYTFKDSMGSTATRVGPVLATDTWIFMAATFPDMTYQGQERFTLYIDNGGGLVIWDAPTWNYTTPLASSSFGYDIGAVNGYAGMMVDEIRVYDHVMGVSDNYVIPAELQAIYDAGPVLIPEPQSMLLLGLGLSLLGYKVRARRRVG